MKKSLKKKQKVQILKLTIALLLALVTIGVFIYLSLKQYSISTDDLDPKSGTTSQEYDKTSDLGIIPSVAEPEVENTTFTYPNAPVSPETEYFEELVTISTQLSYISHPITIDLENPPSIIIYSHGSITSITDDMTNEFMLDMREYGEFFTKENYIFAASNQHGENWGSEDSIKDMVDLLNYIQKTYLTNEKVNLIGYSMGGLPTWNFMFAYPEIVNKAALLAPTTYTDAYTSPQIDALRGLDIKIWHGNADVNVPISMGLDMVEKAKLQDIEIAHTVVDGATHWDVDTELMDEILEFYEN